MSEEYPNTTTIPIITSGYWYNGIWVTTTTPSYIDMTMYWLCKKCGQFNSVYFSIDKCSYCKYERVKKK